MTTTPQEQKRMAEILIAAHEMAQKKFDEPAEQIFHALLHAAIAKAGEHGRGRRMVAAGIGLAPSTLDTRLCASGECLTQSNIARMLFDPAVLGAKAHAWLTEQLAFSAGRKILMPASDEPGEGVLREALDTGDAVGFLQMLSLQVTHPDSEGGTRVTESEQCKISAAAGALISEAGDLMTVGVMV